MNYGTRQFEVETPHWSIPFRFGGQNGGAFVNEQDSDEDIIDCMKVIVAYPIGVREDLPNFGIPDLLFRQANISIASHLWASIVRWEPRADPSVSAFIDKTNELTQIVTVQSRGMTNG